MTSAVGPLRDGERDEAAQLLAYSFPEMTTVADIVAATPAERTFAVRHKNRLASVVLWRSETLLNFGLSAPIAIAGPGATAPALRRQGILASAQEHFLAALRDAGCIYAGLETPITRWHRRNGWGVSSVVARYEATPEQFRPIMPIAYGELSSEPSLATLHDLRQRAASLRFGYLHRSAESLTGAACHASSDRLRRDRIAWQDDGLASGYLISHHRTADASEEIELIVEELTALTPSAYLGFLHFLAEHNSISRIRWDAPQDDPLLHVVREPRALEPRLCVDKMLRVVSADALSFPESREDSQDSVEGLVLTVEDKQAPWNARAWRVERTGQAGYRLVHYPAGSEGPHCRIPAEIFGPLLAGYLGADVAASAGLIKVSDRGVLGQVHALLSTGPPPYCPDPW